MINTRAPLSGIEESVVVPVYTKVVKDLLHVLNLPKDTRLHIGLDTIEYKKDNWVLNGINKSDMFGPHDKMMAVSVEQTYDEYATVSTQPFHNSREPILEDVEAGVSVRPWMIDTTLNLSCTYFTKSKSDIDMLLSRFRSLKSVDQVMNEHSVDYFFYPPVKLFEMLGEVLDIRMDVLGEYKDVKDPFAEYIKKISNGTITVTDNISLSDIKIELASIERQSRINGRYKTDIMGMKKQYDSDTGYWGVQFDYTFTFNKVEALDISYNQVVFNNLLSDQFMYPKTLYENHNEALYQGVNISESYFSTYRDTDVWNGMKHRFYEFTDHSRITQAIRERNTVIRIPEWDNIGYIKEVPYYTRVLSVMCSISKEDKRTLFNLTEMPDYKLNDIVVKYLKDGAYKTVGERLKDIFYIELTENNEPRFDKYLSIDENLNIKATVDLDITKTYRIVIHVLDNPQFLGNKRYDEIFINKSKDKQLINGVEETKQVPEITELYKNIIINIDPHNKEVEKIPQQYHPQQVKWLGGVFHTNIAIFAYMLDERK